MQLQPLEQQHGFFCYLLKVATYPLPATDRELYLGILARLEQELAGIHGGSHEILLQVWKLHHDHASKQVSKNGRAWAPVIGMGIWPHQPPPALWTQEEFDNLVPGEVPRPPILMVIRLKGKREDCNNVLPLTAGRGALIEFGTQGQAEKFYEGCEEYFRDFITEPLHAAYPFFFPLIDARTLSSFAPELVDRLLGPMTFYLRESPEDGGLLVLSKRSLNGFFEELGWRISHNE